MAGDRIASRGRCAPWIGLATVAIATVLTFAPRPAGACSCKHPKPFPHDALRAADVVFEGRVYSQTLVGQRARYGFEVDRYWKGQPGHRVDIETHLHSAACGRHFDLGTSYVVYAQRDGTHLADNLCSRTRPSSAAASDIAALGAGQRVNAPADPEVELVPGSPDVPTEPPRIEPTPQPPPPAPSKRGCRTAPGPVPWWLLLALPALRRRVRSTRRREPAA